MAIQINLSNKVAYTLIAILLILVIGGVVIAYTQSLPDPGHGGDKVLVDIPGIGEKDLQTAITDGDFMNKEACSFCRSCGGKWPVNSGYLDQPWASDPKRLQRSSNCAGDLEDRRDSTYLCCK